MKIYLSKAYACSISISVFSILSCCLWDNYNNYRWFGIMLILASVNLIYRCRKCEKLLLLTSIMGYINISIAVVDMFMMGEILANYQYVLRHDWAGLTFAKMFILFFSIFNLCITDKFINESTEKLKNTKGLQKKYDPLICIFVIIISIIIILFEFNGSTGTSGYVSNSSALYEYVILFAIIGFAYVGNNQLLQFALLGVCIVYILQGVLGGDRSSAFMMILLLAIVYFIHTIKIHKIILYFIGGITLANIIAVMRGIQYVSVKDVITSIFSRGALVFFSDTVSYSYYTGITIIEYLNDSSSKVYLALNWIASFFIGSHSEVNLTSLARGMNINGGGGTYPSFFYVLGGWGGVAFSAILLAYVIKKIFTKKTIYYTMFQVAIICLVFRWYLYSPTSIYRTIFINFSLMIGMIYLYENGFRKIHGVKKHKSR